MARALLDTQVLLWWMREADRLSARARSFMEDGENDLLWSAASTWEVAIKATSKRLFLPFSVTKFFDDTLDAQGIDLLPVEHRHAVAVADLPPLHRDPFDRLLVAQALTEGVPIVSADPVLARYPVKVIW